MKNKQPKVIIKNSRQKSISNAYIIVALTLLPPIGFYLAVKYRPKWIANPFFCLGIGIYSLLLFSGIFLLGTALDTTSFVFALLLEVSL